MSANRLVVPQRNRGVQERTRFFDQDSQRMNEAVNGAGLNLRVMEGDKLLFDGSLSAFGERVVTFGSDANNDIVLRSPTGIVSRRHGTFLVRGASCTIQDSGSTNGIYINGQRKQHGVVGPGDVVSIGRPDGKVNVVMLLTVDSARWHSFPLDGQRPVTIGRASDNDVVLASPAVSAHHAMLLACVDGSWAIEDKGSFNGTFVNGLPVAGSARVERGDAVFMAGSSLVIVGNNLLFTSESDGVEVSAHNLRRVVKAHGRQRLITDDVSLCIHPGEFVSIVGGSGAGKTTLMGELSGMHPATSGTVEIDGIDLYSNYGLLKNSIGFVPQQNIVHDNLKLIDLLRYAAKLRMPPDTTKAERAERAQEVLSMLELTHEANTFVRDLSGGQRKRASIAVELLSDPKLLFLDEPTSGLDPGIEKSLMRTLANLAHAGRTIILVTHTVQNIDLCDRVVVLGRGGKLCFSGDPQAARAFFGVKDFTDIYDMVTEDCPTWQSRYLEISEPLPPVGPAMGKVGKRKRTGSPLSQFVTLVQRNTKLLVNDLQRLLLLVLQAPLLGALVGAVGGSDVFSVYEPTKACMFALVCAAFWMGILDSIQEICKERPILQREYAGGLGIVPYIASKTLVMGVVCAIQSVLLCVVFFMVIGVPSGGVENAAVEMLVGCFLVALSAMCLGLLVSALCRNTDRALALAPLLIMPQILFSGFLFKLEGVLEWVSNFIQCRWGMESLGTSVDLNALDLKAYENDFIDSSVLEHEWEDAFDFTMAHLSQSWEVLGIFCVVCLVACGVVLRLRIRK